MLGTDYRYAYAPVSASYQRYQRPAAMLGRDPTLWEVANLTHAELEAIAAEEAVKSGVTEDRFDTIMDRINDIISTAGNFGNMLDNFKKEKNQAPSVAEQSFWQKMESILKNKDNGGFDWEAAMPLIVGGVVVTAMIIVVASRRRRRRG